MKTNFTLNQFLNIFCLASLLLAFTACGEKMDEKTAIKCFEESPAVYLFAPCTFDDEQTDLKKEFLGKDHGRYYYKAYNYKIIGIKDFVITDIRAEGAIILDTANETEACKRFDASREHTPHKAQSAEKKMRFEFAFSKIEGKWRLVKLESHPYTRNYWDKEDQCSYAKYTDLIDLDRLRHRTSKNFEY